MNKPSVIGVRIILIHNNRCLFQLRDNKPTITHPNKWSFVSGSIEENGSWLDAITRECKEEIGIIPEQITFLGHTEVSACFYAHLSDKEVTQIVRREGQELRFFDPFTMSGLAMTPKLEELVTKHLHHLQTLMSGGAVTPADFSLS